MSPHSANALKRLSHARIECTVTVSPDEALNAEKKVLRRAAQTLTIDGFRPGNAPEEMVRKKLGEDALQQEVVRSICTQIIPVLLQEHSLAPIIPPTMTIVSVKPLVLTLTFVEKPHVKVKHIKPIEKKDQEVEDQEVEKLIESILRQQTPGASHSTPLTDDIAKALGSSSAEALRTDVKQSLLAQKQKQEKQRQEHLLLSHIADATEVDIAPELITEEMNALYGELLDRLKSANITFADWLKHTQKNEEDLQKDFESQALHRIKLRLGIEHLISEKNITIPDEKIVEEIQQYIDYLPPEERDHAREKLAPEEEGYRHLRWQLMVRALIENLLQ